MNKKLKVAIAGYGKMGKIRAACVEAHPDLELVAICEINHKDSTTSIPVCQDYKLLMEYSPDVVFACTPNKYLPEIVSYFLNNQVNVFCEKPPGRNRKDVAMLHSSATQWKHKFLLDIYLEKGYITIAGILSSTRTYGTETLKIARCVYDEEGYPLPNPDETINYYEDDRSWKMEIDEFVNSITNKVPVQVGTC